MPRKKIGFVGVQFAERVQAVFDSISAMPEMRAPIFRDVRADGDV
jgi:hypothetical protein